MPTAKAVDDFGYNALHWALREAFRDAKFACGPVATLYEHLAPASIDVNTGDRLVRIDRHLSEYFLFQTLWVLFKSRFTHWQRRTYGAFETQTILEAWQYLPANLVRPERKKRQHLSGVLARNEVERDYAYNRALFMRVAQGWYQFNPKLSVRRRQGEDETWMPIYHALNLPFIAEFAKISSWDSVWDSLNRYLVTAGLPCVSIPIAAERAVARAQAEDQVREQRKADVRIAMEQRRAQLLAPKQPQAANPPKWGQPQPGAWNWNGYGGDQKQEELIEIAADRRPCESERAICDLLPLTLLQCIMLCLPSPIPGAVLEPGLPPASSQPVCSCCPCRWRRS